MSTIQSILASIDAEDSFLANLQLSPEQKRKRLAQLQKQDNMRYASAVNTMNRGGVRVREFNPDDVGSYSPHYGSVMPSERIIGKVRP